jgi:hypothetical protein
VSTMKVSAKCAVPYQACFSYESMRTVAYRLGQEQDPFLKIPLPQKYRHFLRCLSPRPNKISHSAGSTGRVGRTIVSYTVTLARNQLVLTKNMTRVAACTRGPQGQHRRAPKWPQGAGGPKKQVLAELLSMSAIPIFDPFQIRRGNRF